MINCKSYNDIFEAKFKLQIDADDLTESDGMFPV